MVFNIEMAVLAGIPSLRIDVNVSTRHRADRLASFRCDDAITVLGISIHIGGISPSRGLCLRSAQR